MGSALNIRDPRARELARALAERRGTSITSVVIEALEREAERQRAAVPLATRLAAIAERGAKQAGPNALIVTDDDRDEMWTR